MQAFVDSSLELDVAQDLFSDPPKLADRRLERGLIEAGTVLSQTDLFLALGVQAGLRALVEAG